MLVNVETSVNIRYGYDIRGEVVGETGTAALADRGLVVVRSAQPGRGRGARGLARPLHRRLRRRVPGVDRRGDRGQGPDGPSAWDGYAAQAVCDAGVKALYSGERVQIDLGAKPGLYS